METILELAGKAGEHDAAIKALQGLHEACHGQVIATMQNLENRLTEAQLDLEGTTEQLRGSLSSIGGLETKIDRIAMAIEEIKQSRNTKWSTHDQLCLGCEIRIDKKIENSIAESFKNYSSNVDNLGPIGLIKKYWYIAILVALVLGDILKIVEIIKIEWVSTLIRRIFGG